MNLFSVPREVVFACLAYGIGCIATGYYLVRLRTGLDIRAIDSGASGSTNAGRVLGATGFALTLAGDAVKGWIILWAAHRLQVSPWGCAAAMIAVVAGHIWPLQLGFRGGKGLAPGLGVLAAVDYRAGLICGGVAALGPLSRLGTATFLAGAVAAPFVLAVLGHGAADVTGMSAVVLVIVFAHRHNVRAFWAERRRKGLQA